MFSIFSAAVLISGLIVLTLNTGDTAWLEVVAAACGAIVVAGGALYCARHPEWLITALALLYLVLPLSLLSEQSRIILHYGCLALFCLPMLPRVPGFKMLRRGSFAQYGLYFAWSAVTLVYSLAPEYSLSRLGASVLCFLAIVGCVAPVADGAEARRLIERFALAVVAVAAVTALAGVVLPHAITWQTPADSYTPDYVAGLQAMGIALTGMDRFRGVFGNANDVGQLMLITVGLVIVCWEGATPRLRRVMGVVAVAMVFATFEADSRSSFIGIGVGVALFVVWRYRMRGLLGLVVATIILAALATMSGKLTAYIDRGDVMTLTGRTDMWAFVITQIKASPIFGYGYDVGGAILGSRYFPIWYGPWDQGPRSSLHDGYLAHAVGVGVPAALFWLWLMVRPWWWLFRQKEDPWKLKPLLFLVVIPALVLNLTEASLEDFTGQVGLLCGLCWAVAERYRLFAAEQAQTAERRESASAPAAARAILFQPQLGGWRGW